MRFTNPAKTLVVERYCNAFVDDAQNGLNNIDKSQPWDLPTLHMNLQQMSQTWERLLYSSGGALKLLKCFYYLLHWEWNQGLPSLTPLARMHLDPITYIGQLN